MTANMSQVDLSIIPKSAQTDLCIMAILQTAAALSTPEGQAAIEKGRQEYLRHLEAKERGAASISRSVPEQKTERKEKV